MEKRLYVWGSGGTGQLGLGTKDDHTLPQRWTNSDQVVVEVESVTSGGCHSAGISSDGRLFLWGSDDRGQLGRTASELGRTFVDVPIQHLACIPGNSKTKLVACGWWNTLAVISSNSDDDDSQADQVFSWGSNDHCQLGRKQNEGGCKAAQIRHLPLRLQVLSIACGWKHCLLATAEGDAFAWGSGRHGQLGLGTCTLVTDIPLRVNALKNVSVSDVFCGWEHSVFRTSSGEVFTCGNNRHGQLGVCETLMSISSETPCEKQKHICGSPLRVLDPRNSVEGLRLIQVSCGWHFVMCLTERGELLTWGKGSHGQLGLGRFESAGEPQVVVFPHTVLQIACGSEHAMVVTEEGGLYTCGWGEHGNLVKHTFFAKRPPTDLLHLS
uniref:RCC1-like domain-containing protein n=1 Tax=Hyaloperonospora arabidopsidis (strain Emoy2) TaxID=559515 RepID=M4B517_HYAAE